jgi:hypothetical protein
MIGNTRNMVIHTIGTAVAVSVALLIGRYWQQPALGWGIGGAIMSISAQLAYVAREKRTALRLIGAAVLSGGVMALLIYFIPTAQ